jgi:transcriptional regulator with XRE-family HTH domain
MNAFGERLRAERERQKIGVRELSRQLGVSASMISQIELGRVMPSVNTLYAITSNLGLSLDELFASTNGAQPGAAAEAARPSPVQRADSRRALTLGSGVRWELLTSEPQPTVDFLQAIYDVGSESCPADALMRHAGTEYGLVVEGHLGVTVGFETHELEPGDSISFDSWTPHRLFNLADRPSIAIWVVVGRRGDPRSL